MYNTTSKLERNIQLCMVLVLVAIACTILSVFIQTKFLYSSAFIIGVTVLIYYFKNIKAITKYYECEIKE